MPKSKVSIKSLKADAELNVSSFSNNECDMRNISPFMSKGMIAAAGFNVETPIVSAIIGNLSGSLPTKKSEAEMLKCEICDCELSSNAVLSYHINGARHQRKLKALEIIEHLKTAKDKGVHLGDNENPNAFKCAICSLTVNSAQQLEIHLSGAKHKKKAARISTSESESSASNKNFEFSENSGDRCSVSLKKKRKDDTRVMSCDICNVFLNSQIQCDQHLLSRKHFMKANALLKSRQIPGKGKFIKFLQLKSASFHSGRSLSSLDSFSSTNHNASSHYNSQINKTLYPHTDIAAKPSCNNCNSGFNTLSLRQSPPDLYRKRF